MNASGRVARFQVYRGIACLTAIPFAIGAALVFRHVYAVAVALLATTCLACCSDVWLARTRIGLSVRYWLGFFARLLPWMKIQRKLRKMRQAGATIGSHVGISSNIVPPASKNLKIGDHVSIQTDRIDVRAPLTIGDYVILGDSASIITCSHDTDDPEWKFKPYGLEIEDYVWIATRAMILPSCRKIGRGAVIGAGAVVSADVPPFSVVVGNPARVVRRLSRDALS